MLFPIINNSTIVNKKNITSYPTIKKIEIGKKYKDYNSLLRKIGNMSSLYNSDALGYSISKERRLASPVVVTAYQHNHELFPIITTLNSNIRFLSKFNFSSSF